MKAERRHELKENTLVRRIEDLPSFSRAYGSRILLGVIVLALIFLLIRYRMTSAADRRAQSAENLNAAASFLNTLKGDRLLFAMPGQEASTAAERQAAYDSGVRAVKDVLAKADANDTRSRAQALIFQGDLSWTLANLPELGGATTQPSLRPDMSEDDLLKDAETAYNSVSQQFPNEQDAAVAAHFGLAAIAENRGAANRNDHSQWDLARAQYKAILDSGASLAFKDQAQARMNDLTSLEQPVLMGVKPIATSLPSTMPSILGPAAPMIVPATGPSSRPATAPAK